MGRPRISPAVRQLRVAAWTFADIPDDVAYLSTYPHIVAYAFIAWRALLPDDRLVELAHLPFGLLGALAIATIARRQGARTDHAVAAGVAWLTFPAVFLQLPTNYTDVASAALLLTAAAFVLGPMDRTRILLAAVAIGLFLGSKPQAAIATALVLLVLTVRAYRAGFRAVIPVAAIVALVPGAESYVVNLVRHGNPVWPVRLSLGPINLPGRYGMSDLLQSGAAAPRTHGNVFERVAESWLTIVPPHPVFDMRIGGLGLLFLVALPVAVIRAVRASSPAIAVVAVATLATPDPAVARYILAFPGLVLALAVPAVEASAASVMLRRVRPGRARRRAQPRRRLPGTVRRRSAADRVRWHDLGAAPAGRRCRRSTERLPRRHRRGPAGRGHGLRPWGRLALPRLAFRSVKRPRRGFPMM